MNNPSLLVRISRCLEHPSPTSLPHLPLCPLSPPPPSFPRPTLPHPCLPFPLLQPDAALNGTVGLACFEADPSAVTACQQYATHTDLWSSFATGGLPSTQTGPSLPGRTWNGALVVTKEVNFLTPGVVYFVVWTQDFFPSSDHSSPDESWCCSWQPVPLCK